MQKLGDLIPWSIEEANPVTAVRVEMWIITHRIFLDKKIKAKQGKLTPTGLGSGVTWSKLKDAVQKLSIKKFCDASAFECSIEIMKASIHRYESQIFDFKELSKAYKNLSEIYEYRYDFNQKLKEDKTIEQNERKSMESCRRNVLDPQYYKISFFNAPHSLRFLKYKTFIYREGSMVKMPDFKEKVKQWFPKSKIILKEDIEIRKQNVGCQENMIILLSKVDPVLTQGHLFVGKLYHLMLSNMDLKTRRIEIKRNKQHQHSVRTGYLKQNMSFQAC